MVKKIAVIGNKVVVDPVKPGDNETEGGLILPDSVKQTKHNGVLIAVGPEVDSRLKEGTQVVYDPKSGAEIRVEKKTRLVMRDVDLLYFLDDDALPLN